MFGFMPLPENHTCDLPPVEEIPDGIHLWTCPHGMCGAYWKLMPARPDQPREWFRVDAAGTPITVSEHLADKPAVAAFMGELGVGEQPNKIESLEQDMRERIAKEIEAERDHPSRAWNFENLPAPDELSWGQYWREAMTTAANTARLGPFRG